MQTDISISSSQVLLCSVLILIKIIFFSQWFSYINTALIQNNATLRLTLLDVQEVNLETSAYAVAILRLQIVSVQTMIFLISTL